MIALYNADVCEYDAFLAWKEDMSEAVRSHVHTHVPLKLRFTCVRTQNEPGKQQCLIATRKVFEHLAAQQDDSEEDGEEEEDDESD